MVVETTTNMSKPRYRRWTCFMLPWRMQNDFSSGVNPYFIGSESRSRVCWKRAHPCRFPPPCPSHHPAIEIFALYSVPRSHRRTIKEQCNIHRKGMGGLESFCTLMLVWHFPRLLALWCYCAEGWKNSFPLQSSDASTTIKVTISWKFFDGTNWLTI
jgi:hypothetical protein